MTFLELPAGLVSQAQGEAAWVGADRVPGGESLALRLGYAGSNPCAPITAV